MGGVRRAAMGLATAGLLALAAGCDQSEERLDRARGLIEDSIDQVATPGRPRGSAMAEVTQMERALAGRIGDVDSPAIQPESSRFVIGSIVAKPRQFAALELESLEAIELEDGGPAFEAIDPQAAEGVAEAPAPNATAERRLPQPRSGMRVTPRAVQDRAQLKRIRRLPSEKWRGDVQADVEDKMYDVMEKYGIQGRVQPSLSGQMKIEFAQYAPEPTQLRPPPEELRLRRPALEAIRPEPQLQARLPEWSLNRRRQCPGGASPELMREDPALATECVIQELRASNDFEYVEKDFLFDHQFARRPAETPTTLAYVEPNDPLWDLQWHFQKNGEGEDASLGGAGFVDFWTRNSDGSAEVVVAVVDTGLEMDHPEIAGSPNVAPGWDMVSDPLMGNDGDGRDSDPDDPGDICDPNDPLAENSFHGTHVAGTVGAAASNNGTGVAAGAWNVKIVPVRALGKCGGRLSDINDAIRWAGGLIPAIDEGGAEIWNENPADIINLSIGLFEFCPASLQDAIDAVTERGAIVVAAAGNARVSTRFYAPGGCNNVITAAAGDARGHIAPYSNYGDEVDVLAPGGDLSRDDNGDGRPDGVLSTKSAANCYDPLTGNAVETCFYAFEQGTSMAAPHVSAALALMKADRPEMTSSEITAQLLSALEPREPIQCARPCADLTSGGEAVDGSPGMCAVACGAGLLNLGLAAEP
ncbi:MAG: S8 family peptidase [Pseudomonadota bacterium]